ncbi:MAG: alpha/beta hydrolase [Bacteroidetes bacterium]|nr:alpha/beta hydrolase [Bacteroidota bacterium]
MILRAWRYLLFFSFTLIIISCEKEVVVPIPETKPPVITETPQEVIEPLKEGSFYFDFSDHKALNGKTMQVHYHFPYNHTDDSPIVFAFHGAARNAKGMRDSWINKANEYNCIVVVPHFSNENFPGGDKYNLGNVFEDGDNPNSNGLNPEDEWTYSIIEEIFDIVRKRTNNTNEKYHIFGHSAGAQFAHRFVMFKPNARYDKVVAAGAGWYTVADKSIRFPYGFKNSPLEDRSLSHLFSARIYVQIGELDNNPNSTSIRRNSYADAQGIHRLDRAVHFFDQAQNSASNLSMPFNWELVRVEGLKHSSSEASIVAADLIFN